MSPERYASVIAEADRAWSAAWELDELRGDTAASEWTARTVRDLIRFGRANDTRTVGRLADALEERYRTESLQREAVSARDPSGQPPEQYFAASARQLEELRGDCRVTEWVASKLHQMMRNGTADDPANVHRLAAALERRRAREKDRKMERRENHETDADSTPRVLRGTGRGTGR